MKIFCSYAFTGENGIEVSKRMRLVVDTLSANGHVAYCNLFDKVVNNLQEKDDIKGIFHEMFKSMEQNEAVAVIITSPSRSIGQIMEIGLALSQEKPVYLFEHTSANGSSYLPRIVDKHFQWETVIDLESALRQI
jgi:hypothetical protein